MSTLTDFLGAFGFTADIAIAVARAYSDPSSVNVKAVVSAYAENGQVVPGKIYSYLLQANKETYPNDSIVGSIAEDSIPWLVLGGGILVYFLFGRKSKRR